MGRNAEIELEVTVLEPDRRFDFRAVKAPVKFDIRHTFEAVDGGTRVHVHGEAKLSGALRLAAGMARRQAEHQFRGDFERLKELLERRDEESPSDRPPPLPAAEWPPAGRPALRCAAHLRAVGAAAGALLDRGFEGVVRRLPRPVAVEEARLPPAEAVLVEQAEVEKSRNGRLAVREQD